MLALRLVRSSFGLPFLKAFSRISNSNPAIPFFGSIEPVTRSVPSLRRHLRIAGYRTEVRLKMFTALFFPQVNLIDKGETDGKKGQMRSLLEFELELLCPYRPFPFSQLHKKAKSF